MRHRPSRPFPFGNPVLIAALSGVRGEKPAPASFRQAQFGFRNELAWWAKFADTH